MQSEGDGRKGGASIAISLAPFRHTAGSNIADEPLSYGGARLTFLGAAAAGVASVKDAIWCRVVGSNLFYFASAPRPAPTRPASHTLSNFFHFLDWDIGSC